MNFHTFRNLVAAETEWARANHPDYHSTHEGAAVLLEEVDEMWDAIKDDDDCALALELVQVVAVAERMIEVLVPDDAQDFVEGYQRSRTQPKGTP